MRGNNFKTPMFNSGSYNRLIDVYDNDDDIFRQQRLAFDTDNKLLCFSKHFKMSSLLIICFVKLVPSKLYQNIKENSIDSIC